MIKFQSSHLPAGKSQNPVIQTPTKINVLRLYFVKITGVGGLME